MNAVPLPLVPVGKDCDCGHPMVWYGELQRCAVYGTHGVGDPISGFPVHYRSGPRSTAIDRMLIEMSRPRRRAVSAA